MDIPGADHRSVFCIVCLNQDCSWNTARFPLPELPLELGARFICPGCSEVMTIREGEEYNKLLMDAVAMTSYLQSGELPHAR